MKGARNTDPGKKSPAMTWLPWLLGVALLAAVVGAAAHFSEGKDFVSLAKRADPWWFAGAVLTQVAVFLPMGWIWFRTGRAGGALFSMMDAYKLSLERTFVNQAFPSLGISGIFLTATVLERHGVPRSAAMAGVVVNSVSYFAAYALGFSAALAIALAHGRGPAWALPAILLFAAFGIALAWALLSLSGKDDPATPRFPSVQKVLTFVREADPRMTRSVFLLSEAAAAQMVVLLMDALTLWALLRSLGTAAPLAGVFASFLFSTLARTVGFMPGGLGTFEAASVLSLKMSGVGVPEALAATLLFRGLNFWLPMVPGYWFSRREAKGIQLPAAKSSVGRGENP